MNKSFLIALAVFASCFFGQAAEVAETVSAPKPTVSAVSLKVGENGSISLIIDGTEISKEELVKGGTTRGGVSYSLSAQGISLSSSTSDILVEAPAELGFSVNIPKANTGIILVNAGAGLFDVKAGEKNTQPVVLKMSDGAFVNLTADANAHVDLLKDGAYVLAGTGKMEGRNADGQKYTFMPGSSIMVGGPTPAIRIGVTTIVKIMDGAAGEVSVLVGEKTIKLVPGVPQTVAMPNGSIIELEQNKEGGGVKWSVEKGNFAISVDGIPTWKATGLGGQSASMTWDASIKTIDLKNIDSERPVLVALPNRTFAMVDSAATMQFSLMTSVMFATSAVGKVILYNNNTKEYTALSESNLLFDKGSQRPRTPQPGSPLRLEWDNGQPLKALGIVRNEPTVMDVKPGDPIKTMISGDGYEVELDYSQEGFLVIRSVEGKYNLKIAALNGMSLDLETGDNVTLKLDQKKGTFIVVADQFNNSDVVIHTATGFEPLLPPSRALNFNIKTDGGMEASNESGFLVYSEKNQREFFNEVEIPQSVTKDVTFVNPTPRIKQAAVSVVR